MNDEWIKNWFRYFKLNDDFERYCEAKRDNDNKSITRLEKRFSKIRSLYDDWGDIHAFNYREKNYKYWEQWLEEHRHLFINEDRRKAVVVRNPQKELDEQYIYLKVPIRKSAPITTKEAKALIYKEYTKAKIKAAAKAGVVKYPLSVKIACDRTLRGVRKARTVWHLVKITESEVNNKVAFNVAYELAVGARGGYRHGVTDWTWKVYELNRGSDYDRRTQVLRYNREAKKIIANTIKGQFPVKK